MDKMTAIDTRDLINAWLSDVWNSGGTPYIRAALKGPHFAYGERNGRNYDLSQVAGNAETITLNLSMESIDSKGFSFDEVSEAEGWFMLAFTCRFNRVPVKVRVPVPSILDASDKATNHVAIVTPLGTTGSSFFVDPRDNHPELKKVVARLVAAGNSSNNDDGHVNNPVIGFPVTNWMQFYVALGNMGFAAAKAGVPFKFSAVTEEKTINFLSNGEISEAVISYDSYGQFSVMINGDSYGNIATIKPQSQTVMFVKEDGQTGLQNVAEAVKSFNYGHDLVNVHISDSLVYVQDPKIVVAVLSSLVSAVWPGLTVLSQDQYEKILNKEKVPGEFPQVSEGPVQKEPGQVIAMADFRNKKS